jgi:hypothetical protein
MRPLKILFLTLSINLLFTSYSFSQGEKPLSPEATAEGTVGGVKTKIVYCRPSARGRKMVGVKDPYGKVWRTGANATTTIEFDDDVLIEGKPLKEGKYALFTIPGETDWIIVFNSGYENAWGAYDYKESEDVLRVTVKATKAKNYVETFTITPEKDKVSLTWENFYVAFKVKKQ